MAGNLIVVGVDGTVAGLRALRWAVAEAARRAASVRAVNAWRFELGVELGVLDRECAQARAAELVSHTVTAATTESLSDFIRIESAVVEGPVVPVLVAESATAALLVVGHRERRRFLSTLMGSISADCIQHARCPVVVVPPPRPALQGRTAADGVPPPALR